MEITKPLELVERTLYKREEQKKRVIKNINAALERSDDVIKSNGSISAFVFNVYPKDGHLIEEMLLAAGYRNIIMTFTSDGRNGTDATLVCDFPL